MIHIGHKVSACPRFILIQNFRHQKAKNSCYNFNELGYIIRSLTGY